MEIKKLVIDRALWGKGALLREKNAGDPDAGKMCCLGHLGRACGISTKSLVGRGMPSRDITAHRKYPAAFLAKPIRVKYRNYSNIDEADIAPLAAEINDSDRRPATKERMLVTLFKKANITFSFTGKAK